MKEFFLTNFTKDSIDKYVLKEALYSKHSKDEPFQIPFKHDTVLYRIYYEDVIFLVYNLNDTLNVPVFKDSYVEEIKIVYY